MPATLIGTAAIYGMGLIAPDAANAPAELASKRRRVTPAIGLMFDCVICRTVA